MDLHGTKYSKRVSDTFTRQTVAPRTPARPRTESLLFQACVIIKSNCIEQEHSRQAMSEGEDPYSRSVFSSLLATLVTRYRRICISGPWLLANRVALFFLMVHVSSLYIFHSPTHNAPTNEYDKRTVNNIRRPATGAMPPQAASRMLISTLTGMRPSIPSTAWTSQRNCYAVFTHTVSRNPLPSSSGRSNPPCLDGI
jgi:hypothetical protein